MRSWKREDRVGKEPEARPELMTVGDEVWRSSASG